METKTKDLELEQGLAEWGFSLLQPETRTSPAFVLKKLVETKDHRLQEGFPVVLANWLEKAKTNEASKRDLSKFLESVFSKNDPKSVLLQKWLALSTALFLVYKYSPLKPEEWVKDKKLQDHWSDLAQSLRNTLVHQDKVRLNDDTFSTERLANTFLNYVVSRKELEKTSVQENLQRRSEFLTEFHLSLLFSPKQKELLKKKLAGLPLTKTEKEYFSRVVRKKLMALANPGVQELVRQLVQ